MIDPIILFWSDVWNQHRIPYLLHRLFIPLRYQYDSQWTRYGRSIDFERYAAGHHVLADAHRVFGMFTLEASHFKELMVDLCINRHDCSSTIFLQVEVQTCYSGATTSIVTPENNVKGSDYAYTTPECDQKAIQYHPEAIYAGSRACKSPLEHGDIKTDK